MEIATQPSWTDFKYCSGVSIVNFEQENAGWVIKFETNVKLKLGIVKFVTLTQLSH